MRTLFLPLPFPDHESQFLLCMRTLLAPTVALTVAVVWPSLVDCVRHGPRREESGSRPRQRMHPNDERLVAELAIVGGRVLDAVVFGQQLDAFHPSA